MSVYKYIDYEYEYEYEYWSHEYEYEYEYSAYEYEYFKFVLELYSSTSTSIEYCISVIFDIIIDITEVFIHTGKFSSCPLEDRNTDCQ